MPQVDDHVRKLLIAKYAVGLDNWKSVPTEGLAERLNAKSDALKRSVAEKAITLARYEDKSSFPLPSKLDGKYALVDVGRNRNSSFALAMRRDYNADVYSVDNSMSPTQGDSILAVLKSAGYEKIIMALHELPRFPANNFNISTSVASLINNISSNMASNLFIFGNPYAAKSFCGQKNIIIAYDDDPITQETAARMMTGWVAPDGQLPVTVCENMKAGTGFSIGLVGDQYEQAAEKERFGFSSEKVQRIDSIIQDAIQRKAAPGMAMVVIKDGKVVMEKTYGNLSYNGDGKVTQEAVYDMASVTKICATTLSIMKLYDEGKINWKKHWGITCPG